MSIDKNSGAYREYMRLAHRADQRLLRLERLSDEAYYTSVQQYGYKYAMKSISDLGGGTRFRSAPIQNEDQLREALAGVRKFLDAPSSTKSGITAVYKKRAKSINEKFGTNLTWQEIADAWEYIDSHKGAKINYRSVFRTFDQLKKEEDPTDLLKHLTKGIETVDRADLSKMTKKLIVKYGKDIIKFLI